MTRKIKILHVVGFYPTGNNKGNIFVKEQIESLKELFPNIEINLYNIDSKKSKLNYVLKRRHFKKFVNSNDFDIVHYHYGLSALVGLFQDIWSKQLITFHGSDIHSHRFHQLISKLAIKYFDYEIYVSKSMLPFVSPNRYSVIPCGVNCNIFKPLDMYACREKLGLQRDKKYILYVGDRNIQIKNYSLFSKSIEHLRPRIKDIVSLELNSKSRDEVAMIMNAADVIVLTSFSEGSPQVIKEAAFCNRPIVTSDVGDVSFILEGSNNSHIIQKLEPELFASKIEQALVCNSNYGFKNLNNYNNSFVSKLIYEIYCKVIGY